MFLRGPGTAPRVVPVPAGKSRVEDMQQLIDETGERRPRGGEAEGVWGLLSSELHQPHSMGLARSQKFRG